jgi:hypothetical protein
VIDGGPGDGSQYALRHIRGARNLNKLTTA